MRRIRVRPATADDLGSIRALLENAVLPTQDLEESRVRFWVADAGTQLAGAIGLEQHDSDGLLRSLVVAPGYRNHGLGADLVETLERAARAAGIAQLVLLTRTAQPFFERLGYRVVARESAPAALQASAEFRSLCPASAVCLVKALPSPAVAAHA